MSLISVPNTFSAGAVIIASQHNANFTTIYSDYNGNVQNVNIAANAGIVYSKLVLTGSVLNADLAGSITDSNLNQITTASKVSGTAITGLASLPSGAGIIPTANLPALGALTGISQTNITNATTTGNIAITSGNTYLVKFNMFNLNGGDSFILRMNADSGAHYAYAGNETSSAVTNTAFGSGAGSSIALHNSAITSGASAGLQGSFYIQQLGASSQIYYIWGQSFGAKSAAFINCSFSGQWSNAAAVTSFVILTSGSAQVATGTVDLYQVSIG